jgi:hypothetical protein
MVCHPSAKPEYLLFAPAVAFVLIGAAFPIIPSPIIL